MIAVCLFFYFNTKRRKCVLKKNEKKSSFKTGKISKIIIINFSYVKYDQNFFVNIKNTIPELLFPPNLKITMFDLLLNIF